MMPELPEDPLNFMLERRSRVQYPIGLQLVHEPLCRFSKLLIVEDYQIIKLLIEVVHVGIVMAVEAGPLHFFRAALSSLRSEPHDGVPFCPRASPAPLSFLLSEPYPRPLAVA